MQRTWQVHTMHAQMGRGYVGIELVNCHSRTYDAHETCTKGGVATWKLSVLDPLKVHGACMKGSRWNETYIASYYMGHGYV